LIPARNWSKCVYFNLWL